MAEPDLLGTVLSDIANGPRVTGHVELTGELMRRLAANGLTLEQCADRKIMNRSHRTLEKYARQFGISFPDYVPMKLRPKKEKAAKHG